MTVIFLHAGVTSFPDPTNWDQTQATNQVECLGAGGRGPVSVTSDGTQSGGGGGGGGSYARETNYNGFAFPRPCVIPAGGSGNAAYTIFGGSTVTVGNGLYALCGGNTNNNLSSTDAAASGVSYFPTGFRGRRGGSSSSAGGGGGGAGGPAGEGSLGGNGANGSNFPGVPVGNGGAAAASSTSAPAAGVSGAPGTNGIQWDNVHGCGSGANGSNDPATPGGNGGQFGGGGSGAAGNLPGTSASGIGGDGLVVITYVSIPIVAAPPAGMGQVIG